MNLSTLIEDCHISWTKGDTSIVVKGVSDDSRKVEKDFLFVAIDGEKSRGHDFIKMALQNGAIALMTNDSFPLSDMCDNLTVGLKVADTKKALGLIAAKFYKEPSSRLNLIGITGTNGKTTIAYLLESIVNAAGKSPGVIGTVNYRFKGHSLSASHTTPAPVDLQKLLSHMNKAGTTDCIMEVSSHAIDQERVNGCSFKSAIFTNLTRDHLDYHGTMDEYGKTKERLFTELLLEDNKAIINIDDPFGEKLAKKTHNVMTYGMKVGDIHPTNICQTEDGLSVTINSPSGLININSSLVGDYNLYNIMAAIGGAISIGIKIESIEKGIHNLKNVPGRLERVSISKEHRGCRIFVDYAHTPDALERVITALRTTTKGRLITLFGCGGDRDKEKRALMGKVAAVGSDFCFVTSDNPRTEKPSFIITEIEKGVVESGGIKDKSYKVIVDRKQAILEASRELKENDTLLIAGKGHEDYQIVGDKKLFFDDRIEAAKAFSEIKNGVKAA